jgi:hypothetical protein
MWEPRRLTTLWASTACYSDSFTFLYSEAAEHVFHRTLFVPCLSQLGVSHFQQSFLLSRVILHDTWQEAGRTLDSTAVLLTSRFCWMRILSRFLWKWDPRELSRYSDWLRAGNLRDRSSNPGGFKNILCSTYSRPAHPASYPNGIGGFLLGGKAAGTWRWPLTTS